MATSIEEIKGFLREEGKKFREIPGKNFLRTGFITDKYTDNEGEKLCSLVVAVEEDGPFPDTAADQLGHEDGPV